MGSAISILVGQDLGAGEFDRARDTNRKMIAFGMALGTDAEVWCIDGDGSNEDYIGLWNHDGGWSYWDCRNDLHNLWWGLNRIAFVCEYDN